jgi:phage terminase large subunit-like protein
MHFDQGRAAVAVNFFQRILRHTKGAFANDPFLLLPWEKDIIGDIFGMLDDDGNRLYQTAYVEVPKKNGKSELAAGIALLCLVADDEPGAEVYSAAAAKEQAGLVFRVAASMVEKSPLLSKELRVIRSTKTIVKRNDPDSFYRAISADGDLQDGINPHCVIADELHRWKVGKALDLWEILERGNIARRQPLTFAITTAGIQDESPLCWRYHEYARQVKEGIFEDKHFYGRIYGAEPTEDWTKPATWIKANPSHEANGGFLKASSLEKLYEKAVNDPQQATEFKRFHLNVWGQAENRAIDMRQWALCGGELRALVERPCYAGVDLSSTTDLTSLALAFPAEDGSYDFLVYFWMPADSIRERERRDKVPYAEWVRKGLIEATPGNVVDYRKVKEKLRWARECFELRDVGFDPWNSRQVSVELGDEGFQCVEVPQGFRSISEPTKKLLELITSGNCRHGGNEVLRWNADCLSLKSDGNDNIRPSKPNRMTSSKRIDGMVAIVIALARSIVQTQKRSVYEERGPLVLG